MSVWVGGRDECVWTTNRNRDVWVLLQMEQLREENAALQSLLGLAPDLPRAEKGTPVLPSQSMP